MWRASTASLQCSCRQSFTILAITIALLTRNTHASITSVFTPEALQLAIQRGDVHIEIRSHMDLTAIVPQSGEAETLFAPKPGTRSIRGKCSGQPKFKRTVWPVLEGVLDGQCAFLSPFTFFHFPKASTGQNVWLTGLHIRHVPLGQGELAHLIRWNATQSTLWMTNVTLHGAVGSASAGMVVAYSSAYIADSHFESFGGAAAVATVAATAAIYRTSFANNCNREGGTLFPAAGTAVRLENTSFTGNAADLNRNSMGTVYVAHPEELRGAAAGALQRPLVAALADIPDSVAFLQADDPRFRTIVDEVQQALNGVVLPRPSPPRWRISHASHVGALHAPQDTSQEEARGEVIEKRNESVRGVVIGGIFALVFGMVFMALVAMRNLLNKRGHEATRGREEEEESLPPFPPPALGLTWQPFMSRHLSAIDETWGEESLDIENWGDDS